MKLVFYEVIVLVHVSVLYIPLLHVSHSPLLVSVKRPTEGDYRY